MTKNVVMLLLTVMVLSLSTSGCAWVGRTAGKAQAKLERKVNDVETGYHQGYEKEKGHTPSSEATAPFQNAQ